MLEDECNDGTMSIHVSSLMFEGLLYVLFTSYEGKEYWLFSYSPLEIRGRTLISTFKVSTDIKM
jgi:hypothetical protein